MDKIRRLSFSNDNLDDILEGGIEYGIITQIYGRGGVGKTNICLVLARNMILQENRRVIYIDTEGLSRERIAQIFKDHEDALDKLIIFSCHSLEEQKKHISDAFRIVDNSKDVGLVVVDGISIFLRTLEGNSWEEGWKDIRSQTMELMTMARIFDIPVIITNQVYTRKMPDGNVVNEPLGGVTIDYISKTILEINAMLDHSRTMEIVKHRSIKEGKKAKFLITDYGIDM